MVVDYVTGIPDGSSGNGELSATEGGLRAANDLSKGQGFKLHGEIEVKEGCQAKGSQEGGSGHSSCNQIRRSSGEHNDILGMRAD